MNTEQAQIIEFGKFRLDTGQKILWHEREEVSMPLKELEVLTLLVENQGKLVSKNDILDKIWADSFSGENNLSRHIYLLRKTLRDFGADNLIENVPRRGYRFTGEARAVSSGEIIVEKHTRTQTLIEFEESSEIEKTMEKRRYAFASSSRSVSLFSVFLVCALVGTIAIFGYRNWFSTSAAPQIKTLAVLPFKVIDGEQNGEHQGLGLTDVLITRLSGIKEINVRPTAAVMNFNSENTGEAGNKLQADAILEGSIYRAGEKVRITARLVRTSDQKVIWNGQFEKLRKDEIGIQNEIALQITEALRLNLSGTEKDALAKRYTENVDALELYQKGRFEWNKRTPNSITEAQRLFRNAIEKDPNFALAYAGLADTLVYDTNSGEVDVVIDKALELDPNLAEAYASRGFLLTFWHGKWAKAEESFKKSIELNPNYGSAHHWYAQVLSAQGRFEEAEAEMLKALEINPTSHNFLADLGQVYYFKRDYAKAESYCRKALEIYPEFGFAHAYLADIYIKTERNDEALEEYFGSHLAQDNFSTQSAEHQKRKEKYIAKMRKDYNEGGMKKYFENNILINPSGILPYHFARHYAHLGNKEKALEFLERGVDTPAFNRIFVKADPVFDDLRNEPRYREVLRKMNLQ